MWRDIQRKRKLLIKKITIKNSSTEDCPTYTINWYCSPSSSRDTPHTHGHGHITHTVSTQQTLIQGCYLWSSLKSWKSVMQSKKLVTYEQLISKHHNSLTYELQISWNYVQKIQSQKPTSMRAYLGPYPYSTMLHTMLQLSIHLLKDYFICLQLLYHY